MTVPQRASLGKRLTVTVPQPGSPQGWAVLWHPTAGDGETRGRRVSVMVPVPQAVSQTAPSSHGLAGDAEAQEMFRKIKPRRGGEDALQGQLSRCITCSCITSFFLPARSPKLFSLHLCEDSASAGIKAQSNLPFPFIPRSYIF